MAPTKSVLIVDDEPNVRLMLRTALKPAQRRRAYSPSPRRGEGARRADEGGNPYPQIERLS
jgi:hypothetical protein